MCLLIGQYGNGERRVHRYNVCAIVVYVPYPNCPRSLTSDELLTIALQRSEHRYQQIIVNALQLSSGKRDELTLLIAIALLL
jgi:hypothetical protein